MSFYTWVEINQIAESENGIVAAGQSSIEYWCDFSHEYWNNFANHREKIPFNLFRVQVVVICMPLIR